MPLFLELILAAIMSIPVLLVALLVLLTIAGVLWAPAADFKCNRAARRRGLPADLYHLAGFRYSLQMLLPGIYLTRLLSTSKKPLSTTAIRIGIILIYVMWANAILFGFGFFFGGFLHPDAAFGPFGRYDESGRFGLISHTGAILITLGLPVLNLLLMIRCLRDLRRKRREDSAKPKSAENRYALPDKAYTRPFSLTLFGFMLGFFAWIILIFGIYGKCAFRDACVAGL